MHWFLCLFLCFYLTGLVPCGMSEVRKEKMNVRQKKIEEKERLHVTQGEIQRFFEVRSGEWSSSVLIKDSFGRDHTFFVHPAQTLVRRGVQIQGIEVLTGGMKVTILYRREGNKAHASVIRIDGAFYA